jgi:hypothetical protein
VPDEHHTRIWGSVGRCADCGSRGQRE